MNEVMKYSQTVDGAVIEYEILPAVDYRSMDDNQLQKLKQEEASLTEMLQENLQKIEAMNTQIDQLTNHADELDNLIAISCGALTGLLDITLIGDLNIDAARGVIEGAPSDLKNALNEQKLEGLVKEKLMNTKFGEFMDGKLVEELFSNGGRISNELLVKAKMFAGQPNVMGLFASLMMQFAPNQSVVDSTFSKGVHLNLATGLLEGSGLKEKLLCGSLNWLGCVVNEGIQSQSFMELNNYKIDLPEPLAIAIRELSTLDLFSGKSLQEIANQALNDHELLNRLDFDLDTELAGGLAVVRQGIPVLIDEILVRSFYFARRLVQYGKNATDYDSIPWNKVMPINNRTIERMMTLSLGAMEVMDLSDAAIRGAISAAQAGAAGAEIGSAGGPYGAAGGAISSSTVAFWKTFAMRVNYAGVASFGVAVGVDAKMGVERDKLRIERMKLYNQRLQLVGAEVFFQEAQMWMSAEEAGRIIDEAYRMMEQTKEQYANEVTNIREDMKRIGNYTDLIESKNPGLLENLSNTLKWGI